MKTTRLEILEESLRKKEAKQADRFEQHFSEVKKANGQPLNDKRNGAATMKKWDKQSNSLRLHEESIAKTKTAIEKEQSKISNVESVLLPDAIITAIASGEITQWRKHPRMFFVTGVEKARITWDEEAKTIGYRYLADVKKEQYPIFRDVYNKIRKTL